MHGERIEMLIAKYLEGLASPDKIKLVDEWDNAFDRKPSFYFDHTTALTKLIDENLPHYSQKWQGSKMQLSL